MRSIIQRSVFLALLFKRGASLVRHRQRFAAVIMRIRDPKTTALIFASGKMVVTGAKSEDDSRLASRKYARIVQKLGFDAKFSEFKIQNIVGSCDVKFPIRLEGLAYSHGQFSSYEPEVSKGSSIFIETNPCSKALPRVDLSNDQTQGRASHFRLGEDCTHGREGNTFVFLLSFHLRSVDVV
jgi:hypothetical protein